MTTTKRPASTLSQRQMTDIRRAIASIDANIKTARTNRTAEEGGAGRRLATRRSDTPWWMNRAG